MNMWTKSSFLEPRAKVNILQKKIKQMKDNKQEVKCVYFVLKKLSIFVFCSPSVRIDVVVK